MARVYLKITLTLLLTFLFFNSQVSAQDSTFTKFYISPQVGGYGVLNGSTGFHYGADIGVKRNTWVYGINYARLDDFEILGPSPSEYFHQIGAVLGKRGGIANNILQFHSQLGVATIWGVRRTEELIEKGLLISTYNSENFLTVGLQAKVGFRIVPAKWFAFGFDYQGNLTPKVINGLSVFSFEFGRLK